MKGARLMQKESTGLMAYYLLEVAGLLLKNGIAIEVSIIVLLRRLHIGRRSFHLLGYSACFESEHYVVFSLI